MRLATPFLTRRSALLGAAALPAAAALPNLARAAGHAPAAAPAPIHNAFTVGNFRVASLLAGTRTVEEPQGTFGMNVSAEEFAAVSRANFIPTDKTQFFFTPTVVNTGTEIVLFDTGLNADGINAALAAAGYAADDITVVVLTHMHGDHIGGLMRDGAPTFANARYVTGQVEYDHWAAAGNDGFNANVAPLAEKMTFLSDGQEAVPGITAVAAFGHTPGHMAYHVESGSDRLMLIVDTANHYVWSLAYPEWEVRFDADKAAAAASRKNILGMVAADRIPMIGYHMPFPALGYVDTRGEGGFAYVPATYQMMLQG